MAYLVHGAGDPTVIFVSALVYGTAPFHPLLERLCQEFRVVTYDRRGAGRSDALVRPYGVDQHALDLLAVIESVGGSPMIGVGISRGSNVLVRAASARPELFSALVLVGMPPVGAGSGDRSYFNEEYLARRRIAYSSEDTEALVRIQMDHVYTEPDVGEQRRLAIERSLRLPEETILSFFDPDPHMNVVPLLGSLRVPTLVAHGREDRLCSFAGAELVAGRIPGALLYGFEGRGHLPMFTAPDEFCEVLEEFVRTAEVRGARRGGDEAPL